jgi:hypothetical protein
VRSYLDANRVRDPFAEQHEREITTSSWTAGAALKAEMRPFAYNLWQSPSNQIRKAIHIVHSWRLFSFRMNTP